MTVIWWKATHSLKGALGSGWTGMRFRMISPAQISGMSKYSSAILEFVRRIRSTVAGTTFLGRVETYMRDCRVPCSYLFATKLPHGYSTPFIETAMENVQSTGKLLLDISPTKISPDGKQNFSPLASKWVARAAESGCFCSFITFTDSTTSKVVEILKSR